MAVLKYFCLLNRQKLLSLNALEHVRRISGAPQKIGVELIETKPDLTLAVSEAEKIVGYPTSFLNLRWLLTDEVANVAAHLRKLMGTDHPLLRTARSLLVNNHMPAWGLIVLLVSKASGLAKAFPDTERDLIAGVLHSQRALAEVTEMVRTSNIIHKSLINIDNKMVKNDANMNFGNKIATLSGDYLLSKSYHELACLRNQELNELISSALRDLVEADFIGPRDNQNMPLPAKPTEAKRVAISDEFGTAPYSVKNVLGNSEAEWTLRNILGGASLLGKSCQGSLMLGKHPPEIQEKGFLFGKHLALARQAQSELESFSPGNSGPFSLICAPLMFHLQYEPNLYEEIEKGKDNVLDVDYEYLRNVVQNGPGLEHTQKLQKTHSFAALEVLNILPASDARIALGNIIMAMP